MNQPKPVNYELVLGTAAEYLVCADLLLAGFCAFRSDQAAPYDVAVDLGHRLVRVQVKGTGEAKSYLQAKQRHVVGYTWNCRHGKGSNRAYPPGAFDVVALVALDSRKVAYIRASDARQTMQIHVSGNLTAGCRSFETCTFGLAIEGL